MKISKLNRIEMRGIDGTHNVRYSAVLDDVYSVKYATDGFFHKHLTLKEWEEYIKEEYECLMKQVN